MGNGTIAEFREQWINLFDGPDGFDGCRQRYRPIHLRASYRQALYNCLLFLRLCQPHLHLGGRYSEGRLLLRPDYPAKVAGRLLRNVEASLLRRKPIPKDS